MGKYDIKFDGESVKVEVLDSAELISSWITDRLKPRLQEEEPVIVGLDLHAKNLKKFLGDRKIFFVGVGVDWKLSRGVLPSLGPLVCKIEELSHLAARIRKDPSFCNSNLKALATVCEVPYEPRASWGCCCGGRINYEARVFSNKEVKALVRDAYYCYKIGRKLVKALHRDGTTQETQVPPGYETTQGTTQEMQEPPGHETTQGTQELPGHKSTPGTSEGSSA
ncbi:hypothetical protein Nepgr_013417 [Nepenthes gracilis]|uniref:Uncharacterized protein n=1 Tax=Nepenthes gracilis TaxID=150966 RepID=A0AAD3SJN8_NEPGR|nr:hypothetical protein Nepgr_013417 [Nepenthes gracilis]